MKTSTILPFMLGALIVCLVMVINDIHARQQLDRVQQENYKLKDSLWLREADIEGLGLILFTGKYNLLDTLKVKGSKKVTDDLRNQRRLQSNRAKHSSLLPKQESGRDIQ